MTQNQPNNPRYKERLERARRSESLFQARSLVNASPSEVGKAAIGYTQARFNILSGAPTVAFTRSITTAELPSTGLGEINFIALEPPLMLVVVKGDFDISNLISGRFDDLKPRTKVKYIAYVFDLRAGIPSFISTGVQGEYFRRVLNDATLPDIPNKPITPAPSMPEPLPRPLVERPARKLPYGSVIPGENPQKP
ncbi:hypothetical protein NIES4071_81790 [Calothrix sp. NIES-4071]|nr:hypothetical protein NIES4071_81790 [Calothrix sp. NIES-4071]BAZ62448.1 hypothetical protein NIES4105_81720 [Calothrix sp. NIES-4105]